MCEGGRPKLSEAYDDPMEGTSSSASKKTSRNSTIGNSVFFMEKGLLVAEKKLERAKESLRNAQSIKDGTGASVKSTVQNNSNVDTLKRLSSIMKNYDTAAAKNLLVAKKKVRRAEENLEKVRARISKTN